MSAKEQPPTSLSAPMHFRPAAWMRKVLQEHARGLQKATGRTRAVKLSEALRDVLHRALRGDTPTQGYLSGYREGHAEAYGETQRQLGAALEGLATRKDSDVPGA